LVQLIAVSDHFDHFIRFSLSPLILQISGRQQNKLDAENTNKTTRKTFEDMELVKLIHDLAITAGFIALAILPHAVVTLLEAKGNGQEQAKERS
jgi:hypothetical protein